MTKNFNENISINLDQFLEAICRMNGCHCAIEGGLYDADGKSRKANLLAYALSLPDKHDCDYPCENKLKPIKRNFYHYNLKLNNEK